MYFDINIYFLCIYKNISNLKHVDDDKKKNDDYVFFPLFISLSLRFSVICIERNYDNFLVLV